MHSQKQKTEHLILVPEVLALPRQKVREPRRRVSVHGWNFAALFYCACSLNSGPSW